MKTRVVVRALVAALLVPGLTACIFAYRTSGYTYGEQAPAPMRRFQALQVISGASWGSAEQKQDVYLDRIYAVRKDSAFLGFLSHEDTVACRYADTPVPQVNTDWLWDFFLPIPMDELPRVSCAGYDKPVLLALNVNDSKRFADAWAALALSSSPGPVNPLAPHLRGEALAEELRSYRVRAETAVRAKNYWEAADLLDQGLMLQPGWAQGHFNLGLICAEIKLYDCAIEEMQAYLKLNPRGDNVRAVKDKIYVWQGFIRG